MRRMKRSAGVTVIAVFALLGSLLCLAMGCLMSVVWLISPPSSAGVDPAMQPMLKVVMVLAALFFAAFAAWGIASSVGLFRLRQWARVSTLVFSGMLIFFGIISPLFILFMPMPPNAPTDPSFMSGFKIGITAFYLCFAALGLWWMIYLTRRSVKAQFAAGAVSGEPPARPISISIIGWLLIVAACFVPINLIFHAPLLMFGVVLTGWVAGLTLLVFGMVSVIAGIGLLRLRNDARLLTIAYFVFGICNGLITWLRPGATERFAEVIRALPPGFQVPDQPAMPAMNPVLIAVVTVPIMLVPIFFLVKNQSAFTSPPPSSELPSTFPG